ncbi:TonB-dependent receptor [Terrimonas sp.]|uniref:TonB-dependent receptor plug domain-containing protein n=1 Tax=Terrimonas sp. TaxID=1914338 RepID=UPI000D52558B|nr:TonB-dependent receptor [Terrimonas sp.]PVD54208.1 TonB-dependent receptor [Terrimonas sp.]
MKYFLPILLLIFGYSGYAQEIELDPITVTATLSQKRSSETGRNITIIKGDKFKNLPIHSLDELLRYVPGVEMQARGPMGAQSDIVLRGGTYQQVLVILDGMRLNDPNTGHFSSYIPIAPAEIERIEILKGASSAIYGADAVGGVINVITKSFAAKEHRENVNINAGIAAGEYGFLSADAGFFVSSKKLSIGGGVITNNADGFQQRGIRGYFHNTTASLSANYHFTNNWNIAYRIAYDNRDFAAQNFYTTYSFDTATEKVSFLWNQARLAYQTQKQSFIVDAGFKKVNDEYRFAPASVPNSNKSELFQVLAQYQNQLSVSTSLVAGINYQQKRICSNDRGNHSLFWASPFISFSQRIGIHFLVRPSLQWVFFQKINAELVPQLDLSYKTKQFQFRASAGKTIRDADFTERYNNYNKEIVRSGSIGNPDLKAERSFSYEAGFDWFVKEHLKISSTFFQRFHRRLVDFNTTPYEDMPRKDNLVPNGVYALAKNIAEVNTTGFETDIQYTHAINDKQHLSGSIGLVWLDSKSSDSIPSFYISSHAKFLTNFSVIYQYHNFSFSVNGLYKKRNERIASSINTAVSPDYFLMNAKMGYDLSNRRFSVFVQMDNVFNRQYSDLLGSVMPGRWFMGGVRYQFGKAIRNRE